MDLPWRIHHDLDFSSALLLRLIPMDSRSDGTTESSQQTSPAWSHACTQAEHAGFRDDPSWIACTGNLLGCRSQSPDSASDLSPPGELPLASPGPRHTFELSTFLRALLIHHLTVDWATWHGLNEHIEFSSATMSR